MNSTTIDSTLGNAKCYEDLPLVLTVPQLSEVMGIGLNSAYHLVRSGGIHAVQVGKLYRIPKESLKTFLLST